MIVQYPRDATDQTVLNFSRLFEHNHPRELIKDKEMSLLDEKNNILTELDGSPIERITIIAHAGFTRYANMDPEHFADRLIESLQQADKHYPGTSSQIKNIDLIGCQNGYISESGNGINISVAKRLLDAGYSIEIRGFTNLSHTTPHPLTKLFLDIKQDPISNRPMVRNIILQDEKKDKSYMDYQKQIKSLSTQKESLFYEQHVCIEEYKKGKEKISALQRDQEISDDEKTKKLQQFNEKLKTLENYSEELINAISEIDAQIKTISEEIEKLYVIVSETSDPRHYLDTDPQCRFTSRVLHGFGGKKGIKEHPIAIAAMHNDTEALREQISRDSLLINEPDDDGIPPLFFTAFRGNADSANILLNNGADSSLAPTFSFENLCLLLGEEERVRARTLLEKKYPALTEDTMVQINPAEIAYIQKHEALSFILSAYEQRTYPLHKAIREGRKDAFDLWMNMKKGTDINKNINGFTPIMQATLFREKEMFFELAKHEASLELPFKGTLEKFLNHIPPDKQAQVQAFCMEHYGISNRSDTVTIKPIELATMLGDVEFQRGITNATTIQNTKSTASAPETVVAAPKEISTAKKQIQVLRESLQRMRRDATDTAAASSSTTPAAKP